MQYEGALPKSEEELKTLITKNADGIMVVDPQGIVRFINPAALSLFGRQAEDVLGQWLGFPVVGGDKTEVDICSVNQEDGLSGGFTRKIAEMRVVEIQWQGETAYLVSLRDITERKSAEEERIRYFLQEAEAAKRFKDEFLSVLSHELRTPLNPILGWSKMLQSRKLDETTTARALETIFRNAQLQTQLIEDLLDISRILQGNLRLRVCPVNLVSTIEAVLETLNLSAQSKSIEIQTTFEPTLGKVVGDPSRLRQVVWNLLSNAVKFTPEGGRVRICLQQVGSQAQIQVSDTGKGIAPDFLPYVFDYFRQADHSTTRAVGGLGLGLAIARYLVELHGGTIQAHSSGVGQGATFTVGLPLMNDG